MISLATTSQTQPGPRVARVLEALALQNSSGVLEIDGNPSGAIYLDHGQITLARTSWSPDLPARLRGLLQPPPWLQALLLGGDRPDHDLGTLLVEHQCITTAELQTVLRSVVVDAIIALTLPMAGADAASLAGVRFVAASRHWAAGHSRLNVGDVRAEATTRAAHMRQTGIAPADHVRLRDLDRPSTLLTPEQWAVACEINGTVSARDLAWRCGLALYDTIERLSELVRMGLCVRCPEPTQGLPDGQDAGVPADPASPPGTGSPARPTRRRRPTRTRRTPATQQADPTGEGNQPGEGIRTTRAPAAQQAGPTGDGNRPVPDGIDPRDEVAFTPLPEETLRRVLEGLRKLS